MSTLTRYNQILTTVTNKLHSESKFFSSSDYVMYITQYGVLVWENNLHTEA